MTNNIFRPKLLNRSRLKEQLDMAIQAVPLIFIASSMGYGKTTIIKKFLEEKKDLINIWFTINPYETDPEWMWKRFCSIIGALYPHIANQLIEYGLPYRYIEAENIVLDIRERIKKPVVIVIDDYHENKSDEFNKLLIAFVNANIPNLHIIVTSRTIPNLPLRELELKGLSKVFFQNELEFTFKEISDLFKLNGFLLTAEELRSLQKRTEGWTSAIYLSLLKYAETRSFDKDINITMLMKTAVYDKLDFETQQILLKLSLFDNFTIEAAIYVSENLRAGKLIYKLLSNNCFLRFDTKNETYTIHSIFKELLQRIFKSSGFDKALLYSKYGDWYSQNNRYIEAIDLYNKAGNHVKILDLFELHGATKFIDNAPKNVVKAFEAMDLSLKLSRPIPYITYIFSYLIVIDEEKGAELLTEAKAAFENDDNLPNKKRILGEIALVESFLYFNDIRLMEEYHKKAYELFEGKKSRILCNEMLYSFGSPNILYLYHSEYGKLKGMIEYKSNLEIKYYEHVAHGNGAGVEYIIQAEYYLEIGDLEKAEFYAQKGIFTAKTMDQLSLIVCGKLCLARASIFRGKANCAFSIIDDLKKDLINAKNPCLLNSMDIASAIIYGNMGIISKIPSWLCTDAISKFRKIYMQRLGIACIVIGKSAILRKSYIELEVIVETIRDVCKIHNNILGYIYAGIYSSIAKYHLYGIESAMSEFKHTAQLAEVDKIVAPFAENMPEISILLRQFEKDNNNEWLEKVQSLSSALMESYAQVNNQHNEVALTKRENKVLSLLEKGFKQSEIASELYISHNTVRRHLQNIYNKLGVNNKVLALKKISQMRAYNPVHKIDNCQNKEKYNQKHCIGTDI